MRFSQEMRALKYLTFYIILFIFGALLGSGTAYLKDSKITVTGSGDKILSETDVVETPKRSHLLELKEILNKEINESKGTWGVFVTDLNNDDELSINESLIFHGASVIKVLTAVSVLEKIENRQESFTREIEDYTIKDLLTSMINRSDNKAWDTLNSIAGFNQMQNLGIRLGMETLNVYENELSPKDIEKLFQALYYGEILTFENREFLFSIMQNTETEDRIPVGVDEEVPVIHKTGTFNDTIHDAAIVLTERPYILIVMGKNTNRDEGTKTIQDISKTVFEHFKTL